MGFGLDIKDKPIEVDTTRWIDYNGIMRRYDDLSPIEKAWLSRWNKNDKEIIKNKYDNEQKDKQREMLFKLMSKSYNEWSSNNPDWNPHAIIFDSPELLAIKKYHKMLNESIIDCMSYIIIPNKFEYDKFNIAYSTEDEYGEVKIRYPEETWCPRTLGGVRLVNKSYLEYIKSNVYVKYPFSTHFIWGDYCGAFSSYIEDIEETFKHHVLGNNSYYALTFCTRDPKKPKTRYITSNCIVAVNDFVSKSAKKYGYEVELLPDSGIYKHHMYTCIFHVNYNYFKSHELKIEQLNKRNEELKQELEKINLEIKIEYDVIQKLKNTMNRKKP